LHLFAVWLGCNAEAAGQLAPRTSLLCALEKQAPNTIAVLEGTLELILHELPGEGLKSDCGSKRTVFPNCPVYVCCIDIKFGLACNVLALDSQRNIGWPASPTGRRCR
jgi:hypothetical protein